MCICLLIRHKRRANSRKRTQRISSPLPIKTYKLGRICPSCGGNTTIIGSFCHLCGSKIGNPAQDIMSFQESQHIRYCWSCGHIITDLDQYCSLCGVQLPGK